MYILYLLMSKLIRLQGIHSHLNTPVQYSQWKKRNWNLRLKEINDTMQNVFVR